MVTLKRAWSSVVPPFSTSGPSVLRFVVMGALLFSAFQLHVRASRLEERERLLERQAAARQAGGRDVLTPLPSLTREPVAAESESESESSPSAPVDPGVQRAEFEQVNPTIAIRTTRD